MQINYTAAGSPKRYVFVTNLRLDAETDELQIRTVHRHHRWLDEEAMSKAAQEHGFKEDDQALDFKIATLVRPRGQLLAQAGNFVAWGDEQKMPPKKANKLLALTIQGSKVDLGAKYADREGAISPHNRHVAVQIANHLSPRTLGIDTGKQKGQI